VTAGGASLENNWNTTAALSRPSAEARIDTLLADLGLSLKPASGLDVKGKLRYYETSNAMQYQSCNPLTGQWGRLLNDGSGLSLANAAYNSANCDLAAVQAMNIAPTAGNIPIRSVPYDYEQFNTSLAADYKIDRTSSVNAAIERESYRREYAAVLERLAAIYEEQAAWEAALKHALAWMMLDDLNEAAHRAVMRIYAGMGERSRAIRQYEICVQELKKELRTKPQPETTALYERIRTGSFEGAKHPAELSLELKSVPALHLPVLTTPFIGRRPEVEQVKELILDPNNRMVTLFGPGGAGKTRLSIQAASDI
jgi:ATP-dependent Clp protease ATP-binding subunit ClpA